MHTISRPVTGTEARRVLRAVEAGRAVTNPRAKAFATEILMEVRSGAHPALLACRSCYGRGKQIPANRRC